ncbi:MAG: LysR family transcriptional regulator, partial [Arenicellales bacterium]|nr:LysR family transcriptional regulator [Arenicellales bacterium]
MQFDLTTIKLFLNSVEQGLIAGATEANTIAPSAVSPRFSDLEMRLGATLLFHQTKSVTPTPAGDAL